MRVPHQVSLPDTSTALAPPSLPSHHGSPTLIDCALEGLQIAENLADKEKSTGQCRRTSFAPYLGTIAD